MRITVKPDYIRVVCEPADIRAYNKANHCRLPECEDYDGIQFGFKRGSGDLLRVIPNRVRKNDMAWMGLAEFARKQGELRHG